jgi:hypothetical protein
MQWVSHMRGYTPPCKIPHASAVRSSQAGGGCVSPSDARPPQNTAQSRGGSQVRRLGYAEVYLRVRAVCARARVCVCVCVCVCGVACMEGRLGMTPLPVKLLTEYICGVTHVVSYRTICVALVSYREGLYVCGVS